MFPVNELSTSLNATFILQVMFNFNQLIICLGEAWFRTSLMNMEIPNMEEEHWKTAIRLNYLWFIIWYPWWSWFTLAWQNPEYQTKLDLHQFREPVLGQIKYFMCIFCWLATGALVKLVLTAALHAQCLPLHQIPGWARASFWIHFLVSALAAWMDKFVWLSGDDKDQHDCDDLWSPHRVPQDFHFSATPPAQGLWNLNILPLFFSGW